MVHMIGMYKSGAQPSVWCLQGLRWMVGLHDHNLNGILADEMVRPPAISSFKDWQPKREMHYLRPLCSSIGMTVYHECSNTSLAGSG